MDQVTGISADRGREAVEDRLNYELDLLKKYAENGRIIIEFDNSVGVGTDYGEDYAKYLELTTDEGKVLFFKWWGIKGNVVYESAYDWSTELEEWESPLEEMIVDYIMEAGGAEIELTDEEDTILGVFQFADSRKIADYNKKDTPRVWQTLSGDELKELLQTPGAVSNFFARRDNWDKRKNQKLYPTKYGKIYDVYGDDVVYDADYEDIVAAIVDMKESGYKIQVKTTDYEDPDGTFGEKVRRDVDAMMYQTDSPLQLSDSRKIADYNEEDAGWYEYDVYDYDGNVLMNGFDTEEDAVEYAETHPEVCGVEGYWVDEDGVQNTWSVWEEGEYKPDSRYYQEQLKTK